MEVIRLVDSMNLFWVPVLDHLWQSTLFSIVVLAVLIFLRRAPARVRFALYVAISIKFLVPSSLVLDVFRRAGMDLSSLFLSMAWATADPLEFATRQSSIFHLPGSLVGESASSPQGLYAGILMVWAVGTALLILNWIYRQIVLHREIRKGVLLQEGREIRMISRIRRRMKIRRTIRLLTSSEFTEIGVFGVWHPMILLPQEIAKHLSDSEMEAILMHELVHIARWDNLMSHLSMGACCLFWFHPLVWWVDRKLLSEREEVCDDRVIELGSASRTYAASLVKVLRFGLGYHVAGVSCAGGPHLKRRIQTLTSGEPLPRMSAVHKVVVTGVLLSLLFVSVAAVQVDLCQIEISTTTPRPVQKSDCKGERI